MDESIDVLDRKLVEAFDVMLDCWLSGQKPERGVYLRGISAEPLTECHRAVLWLDIQIFELQAALTKMAPEYIEGFSYLTAAEIRHRISVLENMKAEMKA